MSDAGAEEFRVGQLVIIEKDQFALEEKWFTNEELSDKMITKEDNVFLRKHSTGCIIGFINGYHTSMTLVAWSNLSGKQLLLATCHLTSLEKFVERLDNE